MGKDSKKDFNPFNKYEDQIEKSDLFNAIQYSDDSVISVSKSGREIKKQVDEVVRPIYESKMDDLIDKANSILDNCGNPPTKEVDQHWTDGLEIKIPFRIYDWNETHFQNHHYSQRLSDSINSAAKKFNYPSSDDEASARREYNEIVRRICMVEVDLRACDILEKIDDGRKFDLTPKQIVALKF